MASQRIKGQEVSIVITRAGELETELTDIKSCEFTFEFEMKQERYLGEKADRFDTIYKGVKGTLEQHLHSGAVFDFIQAVKDKAQRVQPDLQFNITGLFFFPSGEVRSVTIPDADFGAVPVTTGSGDDYVSSKFEFGASEALVEQQ